MVRNRAGIGCSKTLSGRGGVNHKIQHPLLLETTIKCDTPG
ncbi:hypothetical protein A8926_6455 [Saccharopolyspora spinosa]|uniref:Uncharacterized protein n=1 Tax=Saccharopolyspora spinosa TaxID=60894 RepID=A0A2N3Y635_SACSN|nr:hypothetical protein A8926_6455 [Saccharopolyspora spinosa]